MLAKPRIMASIVIAAILAMLVGAASSWAVGQIRQAAEARRHGLEVFESAVDLIASLQEAERSQLAYPLFRDQALQASYLAAKDQAGASFERLRRLTRDRSALDHLEALVPLLESKFQEKDAIINLLQGQDGAFAQARLEARRGQHLMEAIRGGVRAYTGVEKGLQAQTQAVFQSNLRRSLLLVTGAALLVVLLSVLYTWLIHREAKRLETKRSHLDKEESNRRLHLALETLRISEEKLAVTLEAIADAVIATDSEGRVTLLNPRAELLTGWCQAEALGRKVEEVFSIIEQSTGGPSPLPVMRTLALGITQSLASDCILISRDGSECPIADSCAPLRDRSGQVVGSMLVFRDVTADRAANQSVHDSTALIQTILNSVVDGIITLRAGDTIIETINPAAARMFGYAPAELIGKSFSQLIPELDREQNNGFIEYYSASSKEQAGGRGHEVEGRRQDGTLFPLEIAISDMRLAGKSYFTGVFRDITARKLAEDALLKGGALQNAIFNSANFSSIATDSRGVIQIFNVGAERMLGYRAAEVVNHITPADISDPDEVILRAKSLSRELETAILPGFEALVFKASRGIEDIYELTYIRKDGTRFPAVVSVTALRDDLGAIIGYLLIGTDNTARKMAEEALLQAGALQSAIFNSANFSSIATDAKGVIQIFNVGAERMLGFAAADVMNLKTPADISDSQEIVARATALTAEFGLPIAPGFEALVFKAARGIEDIYELTYTRKDGSRFPAVVSVTALRDAQAAIIGYLLIGTDNTARKQAEEALRQAGALQSAIFNSANFSSIATDAKGVIQIFNVGAERMLGFAAADVMNLKTPADISDSQEIVARATALTAEFGLPIAPGFEALVFKAARGIEDIYELTYTRKDGSRFPAVVSVTALRDAQAAIIGYLLIGTDNSARKLVEAEQRRLEQRLRDSQFYARSLFESNVDALMTTDPSGYITDTNKQMEALTGCTRDELIGAPFKSHFTDPDRADASIQLVLSEKKITNYELTTHARDGKETVVSFNATTFFDRDRNLQGVFGAARDVTEAKRLDLELVDKNVELESARAIAEKANQAKSEFLSSMSHELRSPLNAILGFAQLMESEEVPPTAGQQESLSQILRAGWHLLKLIDQILDLAKVESGGVPLLLEPVAMAEVLGECQSLIEHQAQQRGIGITFPSFDEPCFVRADHTRVKQVVVNLLSNAIKYNTPQGRVDVTCREVAPGRVRISIRDTGPGLSPQQLGQLFQAFNRLGQEGRGEEGTGIGLVVAKRLVELMGGAIGVDSSVGSGSEFWFELLADTPSEESSEAEPARASRPTAILNSGRRTVLYVEDNAANLMLVEQIIGRQQDLHLLTAATGWQGLQAAREALPDLILMDINLPDLNGFEVLETLRSNPLTAQIPVIALSANAMSLDIERALRAGFCRYLTKPIKLDEFLAAMEEAFAAAPCALNTQDRLQVLG